MIHEGRVRVEDDDEAEDTPVKAKALTTQEKAIFLEADALQIE